MRENPKANPMRESCRKNKDGRKPKPNSGRQPYRKNKLERRPSVVK